MRIETKGNKARQASFDNYKGGRKDKQGKKEGEPRKGLAQSKGTSREGSLPLY